MNVIIVEGSRSQRKQWMLQYCLEYGLQKRIWFIDTINIFDPYWMASRNTALARQVLQRMRVARPFTLHQLERKLYSFTKIQVEKEDIIMITGIDAFEESPLQTRDYLLTLLPRTEVILGWEELLHPHALKWKHNYVSLRATSSLSVKKTKNTLHAFMQT